MARQKRKPRISPEKIDRKKDARIAVRELREAIGYHDHRYYVENDPVISDAEYDGLMEKLGDWRRGSRTYGAQTPPHSASAESRRRSWVRSSTLPRCSASRLPTTRAR
jgi:NAD-dependent DNA ligase